MISTDYAPGSTLNVLCAFLVTIQCIQPPEARPGLQSPRSRLREQSQAELSRGRAARKWCGLKPRQSWLQGADSRNHFGHNQMALSKGHLGTWPYVHEEGRVSVGVSVFSS